MFVDGKATASFTCYIIPRALKQIKAKALYIIRNLLHKMF